VSWLITVGHFVGSLATKSINRTLSKSLTRLAASELKLIAAGGVEDVHDL
jgi:hypothetical protein